MYLFNAEAVSRSGGRVVARVRGEVADKGNYVVTRSGSTLAGAEGRVAADRFVTLARVALRRNPCRMGLKENNRRF